MTEAKWLKCSNIWELTEFLHERQDERRLRLFAYACSQRFLSEQSEEIFHRALKAVERRAEGNCSDEELQEIHRIILDRINDLESTLRNAEGIIVSNQRLSIANAFLCAVSPHFTRKEVSAGIVSTIGSLVFYVRSSVAAPVWELTQSREETDKIEEAESVFQVSLVKELFGNPFRSAAFSPESRTDTAVALARQMYDSRDFSAMPILADALQDAGCDNDDILNHCRGEGPHVRGCWVVDLVLGKE